MNKVRESVFKANPDRRNEKFDLRDMFDHFDLDGNGVTRESFWR